MATTRAAQEFERAVAAYAAGTGSWDRVQRTQEALEAERAESEAMAAEGRVWRLRLVVEVDRGGGEFEEAEEVIHEAFSGLTEQQALRIAGNLMGDESAEAMLSMERRFFGPIGGRA